MILWNLVLAVHLLAMAAWVGGMAYALLVLPAGLTLLEPATQRTLQQRTGRRFFLIVWHAMPLMLLTGWAMIFGVYGGFAHLPWDVNAMHLLGLIMAGVFLALFFGPWKRLRAAQAPEAAIAAASSVRSLITVQLGLGVVTVVVASLGHWTS